MDFFKTLFYKIKIRLKNAPNFMSAIHIVGKNFPYNMLIWRVPQLWKIQLFDLRSLESGN